MLKEKLSGKIHVWIIDIKHNYITRFCNYCGIELIAGDKIVSKYCVQKTRYYCYGCAKLVRLI